MSAAPNSAPLNMDLASVVEIKIMAIALFSIFVGTIFLKDGMEMDMYMYVYGVWELWIFMN